MGKLIVFNFITLNGFYKGPDGDLSWHKHEGEESNFASENLKANGILLFGRTTYEMMANYWPTPMALQNDRAVAEGMNKSEKIVFSRTLKKANWNNTTIIKDNIADAIRKRKETSEQDMVILGSGSIVTLFTEKGLIDEYQIMIDPVVLGKGTPIFNGLKKQPNLKLIDVRSFKSGVVLHSYKLQ
jgi:dihydrofolate reductase